MKPHRPSVAGARHETQVTEPAGSHSSEPLAEQTRGSRGSQHVRRGRAPSQPRALPVSAHELLEGVPDAVIGVDGEESIAFVNIQAAKMFGYKRTELLGQQVELLLPDRLREAHTRHRADYHANPTMRPMGVGLDLLGRRVPFASVLPSGVVEDALGEGNAA